MSVLDKLNQIKSCKEDIKQAIIDKGVDMTDTPFTEYATKISEIQAGSGSSDYLEFKNNMTTYSNRKIEEIGEYSFIGCSNLTSVNLPNVKRINTGAFRSCDLLSSVNIPECEYVGGESFQYCNSLQAIDLPECKEIYGSGFYNCQSLSSVNIPKCEYVGGESFHYCNSLQAIDLPLCEEIKEYALSDTGLTSIDLPECYKVDYNCFSNNGQLKTANLPKCEFLGGTSFDWCENLTSVNLPVCNNIGWGTFNGCRLLTALDLSKTYRCTLETPDAFSETPLRNGEGSIYVHNSVLSQFQNAENWSEFADRFVGVGEDGEVMLAFENGNMYGDTYVINNNFEEYLGISKSDITQINLPKVQRLTFNEWQEGVQFSYCENLISINFQNATHVGRYMFQGCCSLNSVNLDSCTRIDYSAFWGCGSLTELNLPNCGYIGNSAFTDCFNLKTLTIGTNLTTVCEAEDICQISIMDNLEKIYVPTALLEEYKNHHYWGQFADKFEIPDPIALVNGVLCGTTDFITQESIDELGIDRNEITSVDLPNCNNVGEHAFDHCEALTSVNLPNCNEVEAHAFEWCSSLTEIFIPWCNTVGEHAFDHCEALTSVNLPLCDYIGDNAFVGCNNLRTLYVGTMSDMVCYTENPDITSEIEHIYVNPKLYQEYKYGETHWGMYQHALEGKYVLYTIEGLLNSNITEIDSGWRNEYNITDNITDIYLPYCNKVVSGAFLDNDDIRHVDLPQCNVIETEAFKYCDDLRTLNIQECEYIGARAFMFCHNLQHIDAPMCKTLDTQAFYECGNLITARLPQCSSIGEQAFYGGAELTTMYVGTETNTVCSVGYEAIPVLNMTTIYVPASLVEDYKTTPVWSEFADKFVGV